MKKKILFFSVFYLFLSTFTPLVNVKAEELSPSPTPNAQSNQSKTINYNLAYPGILADNPLYKLKVLRDRISATLISDPQKKIDFYLLQADKGILATAILVDYGKTDLASTTALKAEHNYTILVNELRQTHTKPNSDTFRKLKIAASKHQEVLNSTIKKLPAEKQKTFKTVLDFSKRNLKSVELMEKRDPKTWTDWDNVKLE